MLPQADGLEFRPLRPGDVDGWLLLARKIAAFDQLPWQPQRSELEGVLKDPLNPASENTVAGVDAQGMLRAYGSVQKNPTGEKAVVHGGVDPQWRRRGAGAAVLAWQERRAVARFAIDNAGAAAVQMPRVRTHGEEGNPGEQALLAGAGYSVVRHFVDMVRPLTGLPSVAVPAGLEIVSLAPELMEAVRLAHNEAFADHWGSEPRSVERWAVQMRHEHMRHELCTIAVDRATGEVAGYQLATVDPDAPGGVGEGYTELLGVRAPWRGRGLARALLAAAMERFASAGLDRAALDVDMENPSGALGLYERMGYRPVRRSMAWDKLVQP